MWLHFLIMWQHFLIMWQHFPANRKSEISRMRVTLKQALVMKMMIAVGHANCLPFLEGILANDTFVERLRLRSAHALDENCALLDLTSPNKTK